MLHCEYPTRDEMVSAKGVSIVEFKKEGGEVVYIEREIPGREAVKLRHSVRLGRMSIFGHAF